MKLTIELVPSTSWYSNVRSMVSKKEWDIIRKKCYQMSNYICDICGGKGNKHPVECHEVWEYNDKTKLQKLLKLTSLCPSCHSVKHAGFRITQGKQEFVIKHLQKVNNIDRETAITLLRESFNIFEQRSKFEWNVDISFLKQYLNKA